MPDIKIFFLQNWSGYEWYDRLNDTPFELSFTRVFSYNNQSNWYLRWFNALHNVLIFTHTHTRTHTHTSEDLSSFLWVFQSAIYWARKEKVHSAGYCSSSTSRTVLLTPFLSTWNVNQNRVFKKLCLGETWWVFFLLPNTRLGINHLKHQGR